MEIELNKSNFKPEVLDYSGTALVDFWAPWCGPCRMLAPEISKLESELGDTLKIGKVNVDDNAALCLKYHITTIPTVMVFKNGKLHSQSVGCQSSEDLQKLL